MCLWRGGSGHGSGNGSGNGREKRINYWCGVDPVQYDTKQHCGDVKRCDMSFDEDFPFFPYLFCFVLSSNHHFRDWERRLRVWWVSRTRAVAVGFILGYKKFIKFVRAMYYCK